MTIDIHIDPAEQDPDVPKPGEYAPCKNPDCNPDKYWTPGYGMAGGGMGIYTFCDLCERVVDKVQDHDYE
jgi:hypothetical protein